MAQASNIQGDQNFQGNVSYNGTVNLPTGTVSNLQVLAGADVGYQKLQHVIHAVLAQDAGAATADQTRTVYIARAAGTVIGATISIDTAAVGNSTVDVDVLVSTAGGAFASVLTAAESIDSSTVVRTDTAATLSGTPALVVGDLVQIDIDATVGTGTLPQGICVDVTVAEQGT